jgi:hypothetical protein
VTLTLACAVWEDQLKKEMADLGPVTLCYADGPMWVDPYRPRNRFPMLRQEGYPTNSAALARLRMIWGDNDVHGPFIMERSGNSVWNQVELARGRRQRQERADRAQHHQAAGGLHPRT